MLLFALFLVVVGGGGGAGCGGEIETLLLVVVVVVVVVAVAIVVQPILVGKCWWQRAAVGDRFHFDSARLLLPLGRADAWLAVVVVVAVDGIYGGWCVQWRLQWSGCVVQIVTGRRFLLEAVALLLERQVERLIGRRRWRGARHGCQEELSDRCGRG